MLHSICISNFYENLNFKWVIEMTHICQKSSRNDFKHLNLPKILGREILNFSIKITHIGVNEDDSHPLGISSQMQLHWHLHRARAFKFIFWIFVLTLPNPTQIELVRTRIFEFKMGMRGVLRPIRSHLRSHSSHIRFR